MLPLVILIILSSIVLCGGNFYGHCPSPVSSENLLSFIKELNKEDFTEIEKYKALPCCVQGYTSITWLWNGNPIESSESTFSIATDDPRVLVSKSVRSKDHGNYTCTARNVSHSISYNVRLHVVPREYDGPPILAAPPIDQWAEIGEKAEFSCSFFMGFGRERQMSSQIVWFHNNDDFKFADRINHSYSREENYTPNGAVKIAHYAIDSVDEKDFGEYSCRGSNGAGSEVNASVRLHQGIDPKTKFRNSQTVGLALLAVYMVITMVATATYISNRTVIHLFFKDRFAPLEVEGTHLHDVFVCYSSSDSSELVLGWLVPTLEQNFGYSCFAFERDMEPGAWMPGVFEAKVSESRRFLLVLSQGLLGDSLCRLTCQFAVQTALKSDSGLRLVCALPTQPIEQDLLGESLRLILSVASKATLPPVDGATDQDYIKFWNQLRLRLPPRRPEPKPRVYRMLSTSQV